MLRPCLLEKAGRVLVKIKGGKMKVVLFLRGGLIQGGLTDADFGVDVEVRVVDFDVEGCDPEELDKFHGEECEIRDIDLLRSKAQMEQAESMMEFKEDQ